MKDPLSDSPQFAEDALVALADPIAWEYISTLASKSRWQGRYTGISSIIQEPTSPDEPDVAERERLWSITLTPGYFGC